MRKRVDPIFTIDGITRNLSEWSKISGISRELIKKRLSWGWDAKRAIFKPKDTNRPGKKPSAERCNHTNWKECFDCPYDECIAPLQPILPEESLMICVGRPHKKEREVE